MNKYSMPDEEKEILIDYMRQIENGLADLYHNVEEDETIQDDSFRSIEKQIESMYIIINRGIERIYFS